MAEDFMAAVVKRVEEQFAKSGVSESCAAFERKDMPHRTQRMACRQGVTRTAGSCSSGSCSSRVCISRSKRMSSVTAGHLPTASAVSAAGGTAAPRRPAP